MTSHRWWLSRQQCIIWPIIVLYRLLCVEHCISRVHQVRVAVFEEVLSNFLVNCVKIQLRASRQDEFESKVLPGSFPLNGKIFEAFVKLEEEVVDVSLTRTLQDSHSTSPQAVN